MSSLFRGLALLPLLALHGLGSVLGWLAFLASPTYRGRLWRNARRAGLAPRHILAAVGQAGRMMAETPRVWMGQPLPYAWENAQAIEQAYAAGKGVIFLTPHVGCFEIVGQAWAERFCVRFGPFTCLFRPARKAWMAELVATSRNRPGLQTVPTNASGVRQMIKALRQGQAVGLLPDQVPPQGQGLWVPFFGQDAYTMTLAARLAQQTGATVLVGWGERLSWGRGFRLHVQPLLMAPVQGGQTPALSQDLVGACLQINQAMERVILQQPSQYLWGYGRYKQPRVEAAS